MDDDPFFPTCPFHGKPIQRRSCLACNAAYMRGYMRRRRRADPARTLWVRARRRASRHQVAFSLPRDAVTIPRSCPALGVSLLVGGKRSNSSPSLDRIVPQHGYVLGNVRVISDRANRLKSNHDLSRLRRLAECGTAAHREEFRRLATYVEREQLLREVRQKADQGGRAGEEWARIAFFLDRLFSKALLK